MGKKRIVILGASAAARMTAYILSLDADAGVVGFTDSDESKWGQTLAGHLILGSDERLADLKAQGVAHAVIAVGNPGLRAKLRQLVRKHGFDLIRAIHPSAVITPEVRLGDGVVVLPGAILANDPRIADNVFIGQGAVIGHGTCVESDCLVGGCSALGADVTVGERVLIGWGAVIGPRRRIGADATVGTGACVLSDVPDRAVVIGNPAKVVKYRS